jgi:hypothetical protein
VYRFDESSQRYRLRKLAPRMPGTISEIQVARDGGLEYIRQHPAGQAFGLGGKTNLYCLQSPQILVDRLVAYVNDQEAGNGAGVPLAYSPLNATKDQIKELSALASSLTKCDEVDQAPTERARAVSVVPGWRIGRRGTPQWC